METHCRTHPDRPAASHCSECGAAVCEECGERLVTEPLAVRLRAKVKIDWEEMKRRARLCPECRRKKTAAALGMVAAKSTKSAV